MPFELWAFDKRKLNYTDEYHVGRYCKIGNIVFFHMAWIGKINESGEYAFIKSSIFAQYPPVMDTAVTVSQWTESIYGDTQSLNATLRADTKSVQLCYSQGGAAATWKNALGPKQYFKVSGFYISSI